MGTLRCALVHDRRGVLARESAVRDAPLFVASEIREIESSEKERQVLLTLATRIEEEWLRELFPEAFREEEVVAFDATQRRVIGRRETRFHDLVLRSNIATDVSKESSRAAAGTRGLRQNSDAEKLGQQRRTVDRARKLRGRTFSGNGISPNRRRRKVVAPRTDLSWCVQLSRD